MSDANPAQIMVCPDGPLLVRGEVDLVDENGDRIETRRQTVALCRCGASGIKPFCDGTHKRIHSNAAAKRRRQVT
ncbi:CDGSH iron-sulfur domain-containing protein [Blastococcus sp. Marseille-P5729]|uniref:CDGSH iron-sulfur domain-containing protein n=1 Tax=Blastococcus sp. Marseille-P5729 TaxID=2086582 RepID=UPI000D10AAB6|nr:CDGSH iron-sulfur domain-containing protein [Blastococcus sp. Marseille-P5729]